MRMRRGNSNALCSAAFPTISCSSLKPTKRPPALPVFTAAAIRRIGKGGLESRADMSPANRADDFLMDGAIPSSWVAVYSQDRSEFGRMKAYVCVYRQFEPPKGARRITEQIATKNPLLGKFLESYEKGFYDWGDDPSFFAAKNILGSPNSATWGVCRRDVRNSLDVGDAVVFFCARQGGGKTWNYHFVGVGEIGELIRDRNEIWKRREYAQYRKFFNLLIDAHGNQHEAFHPSHKNWEIRSKAPYVIFDSVSSVFNLDSPRRVATWDGIAVREDWDGDRKSKKIEQLIFEDRGIKRRLRTSRTGFAHVKLNLAKSSDKRGRTLPELMGELKRLI